MQKVFGLNAIYQLGFVMGQFKNLMNQPHTTYLDLATGSALLWANLGEMQKGIPVPFEATGKLITEMIEALDLFKSEFERVGAKTPIGNTPMMRFRLNDVATRLETIMSQELDAMPIWFVTKRRAYSIDLLINSAEKILDEDSIGLLSARSVKDIREAGRAIAFELPTAAGFHSIRAVEGVARGYYAAIGGLRPTDESPLGPVTNEIRKIRDALQGAGTIDKEDLIHIVIEMLARLNNIYRKPITHPDMILELPAAMNVFDSAKCAIELMLEDSKKKYQSGPIPPGFF